MSEPLTEALARLTERFAAVGIESPQVDAEELLGHVLGLARGELLARAFAGARIEDADLVALDALAARRERREPLQHLTGHAHFRGLRLAVGPGVFTPRPETEIVAQHAIDAVLAVPSAEPVIVDLGTGSGAIALAVATEVAHARVVAVEASVEAFAWAQRNANALSAGRVELVHADLASALGELDGRVDVVVSNPPYIPTGAVPRDPEVRLHDPALALYGGEDGLDVIRALDVTAMRLLRSGGALVLEHGELQAADVAALLRGSGWRAIARHRDLTGRDRSTTATRP